MLRDVLNLALGNPDNHGRKTALQKFSDGSVRLSPLFDFCRMRLDRAGIRRSTTWACMKSSGTGRDGAPDWDIVCAAAAADAMPAAELRAILAAKAGVLRRLRVLAAQRGVAVATIDRAMGPCAEIADALERRIG